MNVTGISNVNCHKVRNTNFKSAYVTLSEKNLGEHINNNVVDKYNDYLYTIVKSQSDPKFENYKDNTDFWVLGAGAGSRFVPVADAYEHKTGIPANKISLPVKMTDGHNIHMLDWAMAMATPFADGKIESKIAKEKSGSFGDIYKHNREVLDRGGELKDTIVCCGDNVFGAKKGELDSFMVDIINDPTKQLGLVGVKKSPEVVAKRFGVLKTAPIEGKDDVVSLTGFSEKPPYEEALNYRLPDGNCIANTGMFIIKKEAMETLMNEIEKNPDLIKKDDVEKYDFANAVKWVQGRFGAEASDVKLVDTWEDVGEPKALYSFYNQIQDGEFLGEFSKYGKVIQNSMKKQYDSEKGLLNLSNTHKNIKEYTSEEIANAEVVDGVKIL